MTECRPERSGWWGREGRGSVGGEEGETGPEVGDGDRGTVKGERGEHMVRWAVKEEIVREMSVEQQKDVQPISQGASPKLINQLTYTIP